MRASTSSRRARSAWRALALGVAPVVLLASCGGDGADSSDTLAEIEPTSYVVREPATTTSTLPAGSVPADGVSPVEQQYTVQSGDAVSLIASRFGITAEELANYNKWENGINQGIFPGDVILIPPGAQVPGTSTGSGGTATGTTDPGSTEGTSEPEETTPATLADNCKAGEYEIVAGDYPGLVASKFDVTVDQLDAANVNTPGYGGFVVGITIVIPEKTCPE